MNAANSPSAPARGSTRLTGYILWGLVLLAGGYGCNEFSDNVSRSTVDSNSREPIELQPTIDGQRVSLASEGAEVVTHIPLPDFELTNQFGETVTLEDLKGRPWVASFIFSGCAGACPLLMKRLHDLRLELGDTDVRFVSITVDPENDTPQRLRQYGEIYGAVDHDWWLLTGDKEKIYDLIRNGFEVAAEENYGADRIPGFEFAHSAGFVHVDAEGRMIGQYESSAPAEVITLRRVLTGAIETPEEHLVKRVVFPDADAQGDTPKSQSKSSMSKIVEAGDGFEADYLAEQSAPKVDSNDGAMLNDEGDDATLPLWLAQMPLVNAVLNSAATVLLLAGYAAIKAKKKDLHRNLMLTAFAVSIAFLTCYLTYHFGRHHYLGSASATFPGTGTIRTVYLSILLTHVVLAVTVPVLAVTTIVLAFRQKWERHRRWANLAFPIWLYVSVTGVVIYVMNAAHGAYDA